MSCLVTRASFVIALLTVCACGPHSTPAPKHPSAEARNSEMEKKPRKPRPLVAPPPAYGNKIVVDARSGPARTGARSSEADLVCL
jgi:hypothetical protein